MLYLDLLIIDQNRKIQNLNDFSFFPDVPIVKLEDKVLAREVGVFSLPAVVFFRVNSDPTIYAGDLKNEEAILEWMLVQKDPANEAIIEHSGETLQTFIENTEAVAIYLCKLKDIISSLIQIANSQHCSV